MPWPPARSWRRRTTTSAGALEIAGRTLLDRWGSAEDVAGAVRYLVEADYVTGATIYVDGGEHLAQYKPHG